MLSVLEKDQTAAVSSLTGDQRFISRVSGLGFTPGTPVMMLRAYYAIHHQI